MFRATCPTGPKGPVTDDKPANDDLSLAELSNPLDDEELKEAAVNFGPELPPEMIPVGPKVPDFHGKTKRQVMEESSALGVRVEIAGTGIARRQEPAPGVPSRPRATGEGAVRAMTRRLSACLSLLASPLLAEWGRAIFHEASH